MIDAKEARCLTYKAMTRDRLKVLDEIEEKIKEAIDKGEFTIIVDNVFLNDSCVNFLKHSGYELKQFDIPYKSCKGYIISWKYEVIRYDTN